MKLAGVSLEDSLLRIALAEKRAGAIKPLSSEDIKLPPGQERWPLIKETFQKLKEKENPDGIIIGLSFDSFSHHIIDMPELSRADMRNALTYEMEKYLPLLPEEYIYDFLIVEKVDGRAKTLVLSIRKDKLDKILNAAKESGLNLLGVRCSFIEAINAFIASGRAKDALFIYAVEGAYHIAGIKDYMPVMFRVVTDKGDIVSEVKRVAESFSDGVYISGTSNPALLGSLNAKSFSISLSEAVVLSAGKKPMIGLNFMPLELIPEKKDYYPYAVAALLSLAVMLFFLRAIYPYYMDYSALRSVEQKLESIESRASGFLEARKKLESVYEKQRFLSEYKGRRNINIKVLTELSRILPRDTWLTSMSVDENGKVEIEGFSSRTANIIEPLNKSKLFRKIEFASPVVPQEGKEKFSIKMLIHTGSGETEG